MLKCATWAVGFRRRMSYTAEKISGAHNKAIGYFSACFLQYISFCELLHEV